MAVGGAVAVVVACSGGDGTSGESAPTTVVEATPAAAVVVPVETPAVDTTPAAAVPGETQVAFTATVTPVATVAPTKGRGTPTAETPPVSESRYDSVGNMYRLFSGEGHDSVDSFAAIELAVANGDKSMVPLMIEMLRYFEDYVLAIESRKALAAITGRVVEGNEGSWSSWMEWLASNAEEYGPPEGYLGWKIGLMSLISPRFREFLAPASQGSAVNLIELAWGGVEPDGIPDLRNAPVVSAGEQDYLQPSDRVFGVSINGEHRAYPLRIVNAHEMANDVLGGEPIALAY